MSEFTWKRQLGLCALGIGILIVFRAMSEIRHATLALNEYVGLYLLAFALYLIAIKLASSFSGVRLMVIVSCFALLLRLVLIPVRPTISTDIYRYIWDARVQAEGINPYTYPPASPELAHLRNPDWFWINHRHDHTTYPPVSQMVFKLLVPRFGTSVYPLKLFFVLCDLGTMAILALMLRHMRIPPGALIIYAWSPLVITEFAGAGHLDSMGVMLMVLALYFLIRRPGSWPAGILLAASSLVKPYPLAAIPMLARRSGPRLPIMLALTMAILYLPFRGWGRQWLSGLHDYGFGWHRNDSLFALLNSTLALITQNHEHIARLVALIIVGLAAVYLAWSDRSDKSDGSDRSNRRLIQGVFIILAGIFLLSPTVYPWYLAWTVPFLCIVRCPGWLLLTGLTALVYVIPVYGERDIRLLTYLPVCALLIWSVLQPRLRSHLPSDHPTI